MPNGCLRLNLRSRVELFKGSDAWEEVRVARAMPAAEEGEQ